MSIIKVKTGGITADAVTDALIADDVVGTEHLTANEVDTTALGADAVTGAQLADNAVNSEHYTDGSVDTAHIADAQITTAKLSTAVFTGATDIGAAIADADLFLMDDGAGGTIRKTAASRIKTYVGGGITNAQQWRLSANLTGDHEPIAANWEEADTDGYNRLGDAMTQSSGVFTFPATGYWLIIFMFTHQAGGSDSKYNTGVIQTATNGSSFGSASESYNNLFTGDAYAGNSVNYVFDVTNTSTHKVRFASAVEENATVLQGDTGNNRTSATFIRLGDT